MSKKFNSLKTGVIGVGSMGKNHARIYNDISNLVGVSDLNKDQGNEIASSYNCNFYSNYRF